MITRTFITCLVALSMFFIISCAHPRTLYISNKTRQTVTLIVKPDNLKESSSQHMTFRDSINERHIDPGHIIINFGKGKWTTTDKENLKTVLSKTEVSIGSRKTGVPLPQTNVKHYGWFVNELVFKIVPKQ